MKSSKILLKDGQTVDLVDGRISDSDIASWYNKLDIDGSNATTYGVTNMMRQVSSESGILNDDSYYFGDSDADHTQIVRRPITDIRDYIKNRLLGSVGSADKPIYLENGVPKVCTDGIPYSDVSYGESARYGVFIGGAHNLANTTRCYCVFFISVASSQDQIAHTYIGTFTFRGGVLNKELKCLTGTPKYPLRIATVYIEDGKDSNGKPTYTLGLYVISADNTYKNSGYKITRIASTSDFIWDVKTLSPAEYDEIDKVSRNVFMTQTAMIKDVANASRTDTNPVHIYYDDIICNNGATEYTINISRLVIGKTYRFHIMNDSQAATYLYNYGETSLGTVIIYWGDSSTNVTKNARFALNNGSGTADHTITVARMNEAQIYVIWGY